MAEATLQTVIRAIEKDGKATRGSEDKKIGSISAVTEQLKGIRTNFDTFFELQRAAANRASLADPSKGAAAYAAAPAAAYAAAPDASDKKSLGLMSGIFGLVGGLGKGIGLGMRGLAAGLLVFGNPLLLKAAGIFGGVIAAIGAGLAGAAWIAGKLLPTFVEGMKKFEELDGSALIAAGKGIFAVGTGMAVFGVGGAAAGIGNIIGNIADGINGLFGGKTPFDKIEEFQKYKFDEKQIESNSKALVAYGKGMAAYGTGETLKSIGTVAGLVAGSISSLFGGEKKLPFQDVMDFGDKYKFNQVQIETNAKALVAYGTAMAAYSGIKVVTEILNIVGAVAGAITGFLGGTSKPPLAEMVTFQTYTFDQKTIEANAKAMVAYGTAMAGYTGIKVVTDVANMAGAIAGSISGFFGKPETRPPLAEMVTFQGYTFVQKTIEENAKALVAYGEAMSKYTGSKALADMKNVGSAIGGAITSFFGGETDPAIPYDKIKKFGEAKLDLAGVKSTAESVVTFSNAMLKFASAKGKDALVTAGSAILGSITSFFGGETDPAIPYDKIKKFGEAQFDQAGIEKNSIALSSFGKAMASYAAVVPKTGFGDVISELFSGILSLFGSDEVLPYEEIRKFGEADLNPEGVKKNTAVISDFGKSLSALSGLKDIKDLNFAFVARSFRNGINILSGVPDDQLEKATAVINKLRASFGGASGVATGEQIGQMSTATADAASAGSTNVNTVAPVTNYTGTVYQGPVSITYDNATTWGLDPNKMRGNYAYGDF